MEFLIASAVAVISMTGIYLILRRRTFPVILGLAVLGYAVNIFLFSMGRLQFNAPAILVDAQSVTDPLPQALVLTAIVIGFATTAFVIQLALRGHFESGNDHISQTVIKEEQAAAQLKQQQTKAAQQHSATPPQTQNELS